MGEDSLAQSAPEDTHGTAVVTATEPLPIGEVLALVQADFPDVTISKIRFLESQGLIQPERTASGYRRFSSTDIDRLQWILRQQRDHFLPLKVIRKMLDDGVDRYDPGGQPTLFSASVEAQADEAEATDGDHGDHNRDSGSAGPGGARYRSPAHPAVASAPPERRVDRGAAGAPGRSSISSGGLSTSSGADAGAAHNPGATGAGTDRSGVVPSGATASAARTDDPADSRTAQQNAGAVPAGRAGDVEDPQVDSAPADRPRHETPADVVAALQEDPRQPRPGAARPAPRPADRPVRQRHSADVAPSDTELSADELCAEGAISAVLLADLERFGLIQHTSRGSERHYGPSALEVARLAARYAEMGVEPRHLRMYLVAAEREAGLVEQLAVPLLKQRNPKAREHAAELASELVDLGADLHRSLLRRELGNDLLP